MTFDSVPTAPAIPGAQTETTETQEAPQPRTLFAIKVDLDGVLRRTQVDRGISFADLVNQAAALYALPSSEGLTACYLDPDLDNVFLGSDEELAEAFRLAGEGPLRLVLRFPHSAPPPPPSHGRGGHHRAPPPHHHHPHHPRFGPGFGPGGGPGGRPHGPPGVAFGPAHRPGMGMGMGGGRGNGPFGGPGGGPFGGPGGGPRGRGPWWRWQSWFQQQQQQQQDHQDQNQDREFAKDENADDADIPHDDLDIPPPIPGPFERMQAKLEMKMAELQSFLEAECPEKQRERVEAKMEKIQQKMEKLQVKVEKKLEKEAVRMEKAAARAAEKISPDLKARYIRDLSVPDGTVFEAGQGFTKTWRLRNIGANAWPEGTRLILVGKESDPMGAVSPTALEGEVAPGQEVDVHVAMVAPAQPGRYVSYWRLATEGGKRFGQRVWVEINVRASSSSDDTDGFDMLTDDGEPNDEAPEGDEHPLLPPAADDAAPALYPELPPAEDQATTDALAALAAMGFADEKRNRKALRKSHGNVPEAVERLLLRSLPRHSVPPAVGGKK